MYIDARNTIKTHRSTQDMHKALELFDMPELNEKWLLSLPRYD